MTCDDLEVTVNAVVQINEHAFLATLDRIAAAQEKTAKALEYLTKGHHTLATVWNGNPSNEIPELTHSLPAPLVEPKEGDNIQTLAATIPDTVLPKASDYTDAQRGAIIAELDALGVDYKARARTNTLHTALLEARDMKSVEAKMDAEDAPQMAETPDAVDLVEYRGQVRDKLIDYAYKHGNDKAREMVRAYGEDKKVGDLTLEQLEEIERKLADADEN